MHTRKILTWGFFILGIIVLAYFLIPSAQEKESGSQEIAVLPRAPDEPQKQSPASVYKKTPAETYETTSGISSSYEKTGLPTKTQEPPEQLTESVGEEPSEKTGFVSPLFIPQNKPSQPQNSTPILTEKQVFKALYPDFYITFLKNIQSALVSDGSLNQSASVAFRTEAEMKSFLLNVGVILRTKGVFSGAQQKALEDGIRFVFDAPYQRKFAEATAFQQNLSAAGQAGPSSEIKTSAKDRQEFLERYDVRKIIGADEFDALPAFRGISSPEALQTPIPTTQNKKLVSSQGNAVCLLSAQEKGGRALSKPLLSLVQKLYAVFPLLPQADAFCGPTYCVTPPQCYIQGVPTPGGFNLIAPCCFGRICGVPTGCFNLCGNGARPFIYDPLTGICGCSL